MLAAIQGDTMRNLLPSTTRRFSIGASASRAPAAGGWEDTQADTQVATQFVGEEQAYLADPRRSSSVARRA